MALTFFWFREIKLDEGRKQFLKSLGLFLLTLGLWWVLCEVFGGDEDY